MHITKSGLLAAGAILLVVGAFVVGITWAALAVDDGDPADDDALPADCVFVVASNTLVLYNGPRTATVATETSVDRDSYPVTRLSESRVYVTRGEGDTAGGWVARQDGGLIGKCEDLPLE
jgi:hypothetical protein